MDKIFINKMAFYGYHGVFPEENKLGQRFYVDLILEGNLQPASETDDIEKTIHYQKAYEAVKKIIEGTPCKLVETLTGEVIAEILDNFPLVESCTAKVVKPDPPIPGHFDSVAVEMTRTRS